MRPVTYDRQRRAQLLLALEREKDENRSAAASELCEMASAAEDRADFAADIPRLLGDALIPVRRCGLALAATVLPVAEALPLLAQHLSDPSGEIRTEAAGRLADLGVPEVRAMLASVLEDPIFAVRFEAARGMAALRHPSGLPTLVDALDKGDYRFRALGALGELADPQALPAVKALFKKWLLPSFERTQAAGVLARLGDPDGSRHLLKVAAGRWSTDRAMALEMCGEIRVPGAFEALERAVRASADPCRGAAARGLGRLGEPRALPVLVSLLQESTAPEDFRLDAAEGLCRLGSPEARREAEAALAGFGADARRELEGMLRELPTP
jgi:HEAT repeat protein